jgi:SAM-dependent methyltransferase
MPEQLSEYEGFGFDRQWAGRERVTQVEHRLLRRALRGADPRRTLEVGTGFGRLLPVLTEGGREVIVLDLDRDQLQRLGPAGAAAARRVAANLYHLPFIAGAFTAATMIRVHHHLDDPVGALRELGRVLTPGGTLVVSHSPRPSVGTLLHDLRRRINPPGGVRSRALTFSAEPVIALPPEPFPIYARTARRFREDAENAGFRWVADWGTGLAEFRPFSWFGAELHDKLSEAVPLAPGLPMRFTVLRRPGDPPARLPPLPSVFQCPRCARPWPELDEHGGVCSSCGFEPTDHGGVRDLRYIPPDAQRYRGSAVPPR